MGLTFPLKDEKPSYTPVREKHDAIIKLNVPKSVQGHRSISSQVKILS